MRRLALAVLLLTASATIFGQSDASRQQSTAAPPGELPALTSEQMYADFDALVGIVRDVMPTVAANKAVYGFDVFDNLAQYRAKIASVGSTADFIALLDRAISSCKASHFDPVSTTVEAYRQDDFLKKYSEGFVTEASLLKNEKYAAGRKQARARSALNIPLFYLNGDYYVRHDFTYEGKSYVRGSKVVSCNGLQPSQIVAANTDAQAMIPWDFARRQFYSTSFFAYPGVARDGKLTFVFEPSSGEPITATFPADAKVTYEARPPLSQKQVRFLPKMGILYIRVPSMTPDDVPFYKTRILEEGKGRAVKAAVIDIRGNGGGSDGVWRDILSMLLDRKVETNGATAIRNTQLARRYIARHSSGKYFIDKGVVKRISFLGDQEFLVAESKSELEPDARSLKVPVVYVLTANVFSAAGSLTTFAKLAQPVVSVGTRNPYILGRGIDPFHFSLPNSGYTFRIEPIVDLMGASTAEDVFHTDVEVEVKATPAEWLAFYNGNVDDLEAFLMTDDPFFRRVMELLSAESRGKKQQKITQIN